MNLRRSIIGGLSAFTLIALGLASCSSDPQTTEATTATTDTETVISDTDEVTPLPQDQLHDYLLALTPMSVLSEDEIAALIYMREEEKLAGDVYTTLAARWGSGVFTNISGAEFTHTAAVKTLLDRYEIEDPSTVSTVGVFTNPIMTQLYTDLVKQGSESLLSAMMVGATVEDLDIKDLQDRSTDAPDIKLVFDNLELGSENHLRAFAKQIARLGGSYTPSYISQSEYDAIVAGQFAPGFSRR
jgi:hypothetical protein